MSAQLFLNFIHHRTWRQWQIPCHSVIYGVLSGNNFGFRTNKTQLIREWINNNYPSIFNIPKGDSNPGRDANPSTGTHAFTPTDCGGYSEETQLWRGEYANSLLNNIFKYLFLNMTGPPTIEPRFSEIRRCACASQRVTRMSEDLVVVLGKSVIKLYSDWHYVSLLIKCSIEIFF